ncbi:MAG: hypothetical protein DRR08_22230 [Candidatus Parabeggiatoa sp. nov. 2]|nr:MAG: hypothetical protein B6247_01775 [Beggiatoa sp. 4572_84]RKZ56238.1 MAG: hypothetical protein DRR08_22230 [Gammaproteobacteria bacterium]
MRNLEKPYKISFNQDVFAQKTFLLGCKSKTTLASSKRVLSLIRCTKGGGMKFEGHKILWMLSN